MKKQMKLIEQTRLSSYGASSQWTRPIFCLKIGAAQATFSIFSEDFSVKLSQSLITWLD